MSQIATTPEFNPTILETHPMQKMSVEETGVFKVFCQDDENLIRQSKKLTNELMDYVKFATKDKFIQKMSWSVGSTSDWMGIEFNVHLLKDLTLDIVKRFLYFQPTGLLFTLRPANNAYYVGKTWVIYDLSPSKDFYEIFYAKAFNLGVASQFDRFEITPNDSKEIKFQVPIMIPFDVFRTDFTGSIDNYLIEQQNYLDGYSFGRLRTFSPALLKTSAANRQNLAFPLSAMLQYVSYGGTQVRSK